MLNEERNNQPGWINRLADLDGLPGESLGTDAAWDKLQVKMQAKKEVRRPWFWMAAAAVLVAIILPWALSNNNMSNAEAIVAVTPGDAIHQIKTLTIENIAVQDMQTNPATESNASHVITVKEPVTIISRHPVLIKDVRPSFAFKITSAEITIPDSLQTNNLSLAGKNLPKKKLRVVYLNELNAKDSGSIAGPENGRPYFPVKFLSREVLSSNATPPKRSRDNIITIKLSSQN